MFVPQSLAAPDQLAWLRVILRALKGLACGLLVSLACWAPLIAQGATAPSNGSASRYSSQSQSYAVWERGEHVAEDLGIFTLVQPTRPGGIVRVSVPIGEFVTRASEVLR